MTFRIKYTEEYSDGLLMYMDANVQILHGIVLISGDIISEMIP